MVLDLVNMVILMMYQATNQALWDKEVVREGIELGKPHSFHSRVISVELFQQNPTQKS